MNMKTAAYVSNQQPKIGDIVRTKRDVADNINRTYVVESVMGGRMGNKVGMIAHTENDKTTKPDYQELYFYCLCPQ